MRALQHSTSASSSTQPPTPPRTSLTGLKSLSGRLDSPVSTKASPSGQQLQHSRRQSTAGEEGGSSEILQRELLERSFLSAVAPPPPSQCVPSSSTTPSAALSSNPIRLPPRKQQRRPRMPAPEPLPVVHSSTYLSSAQRYNSSSSSGAAAMDTEVSPEPSYLPSSSLPRHRATTPTDNALEWAMRRADQNLDQLEKNPLPLQKALYEISRGPVGEVTSSTVQAVAKLTLLAGQGVGRASAPVGKWALEEGFKVASTLILAQKFAKNSEGNERKKA